MIAKPRGCCIELTEARDVQPKLSPATSRDDRATVARQSFRPAVRKLWGFLRAWADGPGRISIEAGSVQRRTADRDRAAEAQPGSVIHRQPRADRRDRQHRRGYASFPDAVEIATPGRGGAWD
jgi:hypothetical protein